MLTALLLALAAPPSAAPAAAPAAVEAPIPANALALARLLNPEKEMMAVAVRAFDVGLTRGFAADPDFAQFEKDHPGFTDTVTASARSAFTTHFRTSLPSNHVRFARFFGNRFDAAEIEALIAFYSSPTGTKVVAGMYSLINFDKAFDRFDPASGREISGSDIAAVTNDTATTLAGAFNAADKAALASFSATPLYGKLQQAMPAFQQLMASMSNEPDPELDAKIEAAVEKAAAAFLAEEQAKAPTS